VKTKTIIGAVLIAASACLAGAGVYAVQSLRKNKFDPETLCPLTGAKSLTLIIIDKTDPLTAREQQQISGLIQTEKTAVPQYGRISLKVLTQKQEGAEPVLDTVADLCNPGADANPFFENPKKVAIRYVNAFLDPLDRALDSIAMNGSASASPIAGAIDTALAQTAIAPEAGRKLILISDLMEFTPAGSAYTGSLTETVLQNQMPHSSDGLLNKAAVKIFLLPRPRFAKQQEVAIAIWRRFLRRVSGGEPELTRL